MDIPGKLSLQNACESGNTATLTLLLHDSRIDPSLEASELFPDPRINPSLIFCPSCSKGFTELVKLLLQDPRIDPTMNDNYPICIASKKGHLEINKLLLQDPRIDPSIKRNHPVYAASSHGHLEIFKLLSSDPRVDPTYALIDCPNTEILELLLSNPKVISSIPNLKTHPLIQAANRGNFNTFKILIKKLAPIDLETLESSFKISCLHGHTKIVKFILDDHLSNPPPIRTSKLFQKKSFDILELFIDRGIHMKCVAFPHEYRGNSHFKLSKWILDSVPSSLSRAFIVACEDGNLELFRHILTRFPKFKPDPSLSLIQAAAKGGNVEIVRVLLDYLNFSIQCLVYALHSRYSNLVIFKILFDSLTANESFSSLHLTVEGSKILLSDIRFSFSTPLLITEACQNQYSLEIFELILSDERCDFTPILNISITNRRIDVVKMLLADPRINPSTSSTRPSQSPLFLALKNPEIAKLLLSDPRVIPDHACLTEACSRGDAKTVKLLFSHPKVIISKEKYHFFFFQSCSSSRCEPETIEFFLSNPKLDPSFGENKSFQVLTSPQLMSLLAADPRFDSGQGHIVGAIIKAYSNGGGQSKTLVSLLSNPRTNFDSQNDCWDSIDHPSKLILYQEMFKHPKALPPPSVLKRILVSGYWDWLPPFLSHPNIDPGILLLPSVSSPS